MKTTHLKFPVSVIKRNYDVQKQSDLSLTAYLLTLYILNIFNRK